MSAFRVVLLGMLFSSMLQFYESYGHFPGRTYSFTTLTVTARVGHQVAQININFYEPYGHFPQ